MNYEHEYAEIECPKCGYSNQCWGCAVRCANDGTGEGEFTCQKCGHSEDYPIK